MFAGCGNTLIHISAVRIRKHHMQYIKYAEFSEPYIFIKVNSSDTAFLLRVRNKPTSGYSCEAILHFRLGKG